MPNWFKLAVGLALAASLIAIAAVTAYSAKRGPLVQTHGVTYYDGEGPPAPEVVACKPEKAILDAIVQVHAKYDYYTGVDLSAFETRAVELKGLAPLNVDKLYVITEDDKLRDGQMVLFIGLKDDCVKTVFGFPTRIYHQIMGKSEG